MNEKTVRRALKSLNAESFQIPGKMHAGWSWRLPNSSPADEGSLSRDDKDGSNRESDYSPLQSSLSQTGQERKRSPYQGNSTISPDDESDVPAQGHLVTFPVSPKGANGQVRKETPADPLAPTGTEEWSIEI